MSAEKYDKLIESGYDFDMSLYMNEGWNLIKKGLPNFIGYGLIVVVGFFVISLLWESIGLSYNYYSLGVNYLVEFISEIFQATLFAGIYIFCRGLSTNREDFGQFFHGFRSLQDIAICVIIVLCAFLPFKLLFAASSWSLFQNIGFSGLDDILSSSGLFGASVLGGSSLIISILAIIIYTMYTFAVPLIVDDELKFWEAMEVSRKVIIPKFFNFVLLYVVIALSTFFGVVLTCGLGLVVAIPYTYCVIFAAYENILGPYQNSVINEIDQFGMEEIDINTESEDNNLQ